MISVRPKEKRKKRSFGVPSLYRDGGQDPLEGEKCVDNQTPRLAHIAGLAPFELRLRHCNH